MATINKTESGAWRAQIRLTGWPNQVKTFRIKRDAESWARTTEDEIIRGIHVPRSNSEKLTIASALDRYVKEIIPTKKPSGHRRDTGRAEFLKSRLGQYSLAALNSELIAAFRDDRLAEGKANNTVRLELALLSHMYTVAIQEWGTGLIANPVLNVRKPSPGNGRNRRLNGNEEERLLKACDVHTNPFLGWIVRLALYTSMRRGEIISLTREQVNLEAKTLFLPDTKNNSVRTVPLTNKALTTIKEALDFPLRPKETNLLFYGSPTRDGTLKPYTINRVWVQALERAEITGLTFHDLRHEATSRLVEAGLSDQEVASITGHKSMQMLRRYTHLRTEDLVSKIADI